VPPHKSNLWHIDVVHPVVEHGCQLWNPFTHKDIQLLETIQRCAARWVCGSRWDPSVFCWSKSSDQCLHQLGWPSLGLRREYLLVNLLDDIIHNKIAIKLSDFCSFVSSCTRQHPLSIFPLQSTINCLRYSFFGNISFIWNKIPCEVLSIKKRVAFRRAVTYYFLVMCNCLCTCVSVFLFVNCALCLSVVFLLPTYVYMCM